MVCKRLSEGGRLSLSHSLCPSSFIVCLHTLSFCLSFSVHLYPLIYSLYPSFYTSPSIFIIYHLSLLFTHSPALSPPPPPFPSGKNYFHPLSHLLSPALFYLFFFPSLFLSLFPPISLFMPFSSLLSFSLLFLPSHFLFPLSLYLSPSLSLCPSLPPPTHCMRNAGSLLFDNFSQERLLLVCIDEKKI